MTTTTASNRRYLRALPESHDDEKSPFYVRPEHHDYYMTSPTPKQSEVEEYAHIAFRQRITEKQREWEQREDAANMAGKFLSRAPLDAELENLRRSGPGDRDRELGMHWAIRTAATKQHRADEAAAERAREAAEAAERLRLARICPSCGTEDVDVYSVTSPLAEVTKGEEPRACTVCAPSVLAGIEEELLALTARRRAPNGLTYGECAENYVVGLIRSGALKPQHPAIARDSDMVAALAKRSRITHRMRKTRA